MDMLFTIWKIKFVMTDIYYDTQKQFVACETFSYYSNVKKNKDISMTWPENCNNVKICVIY